MTDIKELALRIGKERALWINDEWITDFAQRFLAAYLAEQEPVAWLFDTEEDGKYWYDRYQPCGRPVFAAPLPEPAPQQQNSKSESGESSGKPAVGAAPLPEDVLEMVERLHDASFYPSISGRWAAQAADMLKRLAAERDMYREANRLKAGRIQRQVPDDLVGEIK